eukprot:CAMPEP_0206291104 /NCGR_PEP_ID=MMETSP0106_2-20121207/2955_1 /ASSEMBLY_ACC=CAM_ASM_000206 /TAXON_ID=81532 /ORGANISM="Acanthoeca-like sp., Strain 10tr" /LENGTH=614 /DNA_ID=CAMNT_0053721669 /DNA_START=135 /DNA_END=1979 /DNA_ORIENTATION=+
MPLASVFSWSPTHVHASTTALHEQVQLTATNTASVANMTMQAAELARVNCVQNHTYRAFGWRERGPLFYLRGCNREAVIDFEGWSRRTGCPKMAVEELLIHVGWTGPWLPHFLPDMFGLLDSFLATQDTPRTKLIFWLMDRKPDPAKDEIVRRYAAISDGAIQFRFANVTELQVGTCIAANPAMWSPPGKIQPQVKSDLLRILLLHKFGGVWVDTDTILLRDIRPLVAFFGEFGGKFAMNQKFNNAILSLRKESRLSRAMLALACEHPKSVDRHQINAFCAKTGSPCNPTWWYNHGFLQYFSRKGWMAAMPLQYADPANNCAARGMLSKDGGRTIESPWSLSKVLELVRGAYLLHTRSYQATARPLHNKSTFQLLFQEARRLADRRGRGEGGKTSIVPHGLRSTEMNEQYKELLSLLDSTPYPDPPFFPEGHGQRNLVASGTGSAAVCLVFDTKGGRQPYELPMVMPCAKAVQQKDERAVWLWHPVQRKEASKKIVGYFRPSFTRTSNVFCLTGASFAQKRREPRFRECDGTASQRWMLVPHVSADTSPGTAWEFELKNAALDACLEPQRRNEPGNDPLSLKDCTSTHLVRRGAKWRLVPPGYIGAQASIVPHG